MVKTSLQIRQPVLRPLRIQPFYLFIKLVLTLLYLAIYVTRVLLKNLQKELYAEAGISQRKAKQIETAEPGAVMYLPLGPGQSIRCPTAADSAAVSLAQMTFLATTMNIFSVVANISNNINNNNNNNNQVSYNAQSNNNVVTNTNVNNGNQVNVMVPVLNP